MSWKSIVITGLLCVVASPVLAAPTVSASLLGLDTAGNWVWEVSVDPDDTLFTNPANDSPDRGNGGSVSLEVGVSATGRGVVSAAPNLTNFPVPAPAGQPFGNAPAGWGTDIDGDTVRDEGVRFNVATDRVVAFLGSDFFGSINFGASNGAPKAAFRVHTDRPTSSSLTTTLNFLGAYNANGTTGGALPGVAQGGALSGLAIPAAAKAVVPGNTNLDGFVNVGDLGTLATFYNPAYVPGGANPARRWQDGDFTGDGIVNIGDLGELATFYGGATVVDPAWSTAGSVSLPTTPGAGGGSLVGAGVPEPTSLVMLVLGSLLAAVRMRKR
jgi:hypothetical protein